MDKAFAILKELEQELLKNIKLEKKRSLYDKINWNLNCSIIYWERWIWKTYMLLQKRKETWLGFYFSVDSHLIEWVWLFNFVFYIIKNYNINVFYIDEIHKYSNWILEIKNLIDTFSSVKFVISWSNSITLYKWAIDLWRRIVDYRLFPLSFKEFLEFDKNISISSYNFEYIIKNYKNIVLEYSKDINEVIFQKYITKWYYPFWLNENFALFSNRLNKLLDQIVLDDMQWLFNFTSITANKLTKLFYFIANNKPSDISILSIAKKIWINKDSLSNLLYVLDKIWIIKIVSKYWDLTDNIKKQQKIFLWNPNIYKVNWSEEIWTIRESYFLSQISRINADIFWIKEWDYSIKIWKNDYRFEVWWKNKDFKQIWKNQNNFLAVDDIYAWENKIPLWIFGLIE